MKIAVFGLGYVGSVCSACLAAAGHEVIGVDVNQTKVDLINNGEAPVVENRLDHRLRSAVARGSLRATTDPDAAIMQSDMAWVCVGTPSANNGTVALSQIERVAQAIGTALAARDHFYTVVLRSTVLPGTVRHKVGPKIEAHANKRVGVEFGLCYHPEFLREGNAVDDFEHPPKIVIGASDDRSGDLLAELYRQFDSPIFRMPLEEAELIKYVDNSWHALKVTFANEIGRLAREVGVDGHRIMSVFARDTKLNISPNYLRPGFGFGGSCLPKDLRALTHFARTWGIEMPVLDAVLPSNVRTLEEGVRLVVERGKKRIGLVGLSFKPGTDDLRESPLMELAERLLGKGFDVRIFDSGVSTARLIGANRRFVEERIPHLTSLMVDAEESLIAHAEVVVLGHSAGARLDIEAILGAGKSIVDLCGIGRDFAGREGYHGIGW
jgi:GDP-mannose 6-dehydrogenase